MLHNIVTVFSIAIILELIPHDTQCQPIEIVQSEKCLLSRKPKTDFSVECVRVLFKCGKVGKQFELYNKLSGKRTVNKNGNAGGE